MSSLVVTSRRRHSAGTSFGTASSRKIYNYGPSSGGGGGAVTFVAPTKKRNSVYSKNKNKTLSSKPTTVTIPKTTTVPAVAAAVSPTVTKKPKSPPTPPSKLGWRINAVRGGGSGSAIVLKPLEQSSSLDNLARMQALHMAKRGKVCNSFESPDELRLVLNARRAGENVVRSTEGVPGLIRSATATKSCLSNILSPEFDEFGVGVAVDDATTTSYMCVLFRSNDDDS